jgi:hypothetical protein
MPCRVICRERLLTALPGCFSASRLIPHFIGRDGSSTLPATNLLQKIAEQ